MHRDPGTRSSNLRVAPLLWFQVDWGSYRLGAELQSQDQTTEKLKALPQHRLDQQEDQTADAVKIFHFSEAVTQLSSLISGLERMAKELDARTLKVYFLRHPQIQGGILGIVNSLPAGPFWEV